MGLKKKYREERKTKVQELLLRYRIREEGKKNLKKKERKRTKKTVASQSERETTVLIL